MLLGVGLLNSAENYFPAIPQTPVSEAEIMLLDSSINSPYTEYTPFITSDEQVLIFESDRPGGVGMMGDFDLWYARNTTPHAAVPSFTLPANMGKPVNSSGFDGLPSLRKMADGTYELYFTSYASETRGGPFESNIYYCRQQGNAWSEPQQVIGVNSDFHDRMPSISPDGKKLYFSSNRPGGYGKDDIWVSEYDEKTRMWKSPINLGSTVNSSDSEISPSIHVDGITLYFSSNRAGGVGKFDIYVTQTLVLGQWKKPQNLGTPFNSTHDDEYPTVLQSGEYIYFTSNRPGGFGGFDIYRARVPAFAKPTVMITFKGKVFELGTMKGIEANVNVRGPLQRFDIATGLPSGEFELKFVNNNIYELLITAPGYEPVRYNLDLRSNHQPITLTQNFPMVPTRKASSSLAFELKYFDTSGLPVAGRSTYRFHPYETAMHTAENGMIYPPGAAHEDREDFILRASIEVETNAEGLEPHSAHFRIKDLMESPNRRDDGTIVIPIEMKRIEGSTAPVNGSITLAAILYFNTNIANNVYSPDRNEIKALALKLKDFKGMIELHGHTDSKGGKEQNVILSKQRAEYVKTLLVSFGIPAEQIRVYWHHYSRPAVREVDEASRAKNRRVEVILRKPDENNNF